MAIIYAHGNGLQSSPDFTTHSSLFDEWGSFHNVTYEHPRKRKIVSIIFSKERLSEFELQIRSYVATFIPAMGTAYLPMLLKDVLVRGREGRTGRIGRLWLDVFFVWGHFTHSTNVSHSSLFTGAKLSGV